MAERNVNTISLPTKVWQPSNASMHSLKGLKTGSLNNDDLERLHQEAIRTSFVIKWLILPMSMSFGAEEQTWLDGMLIDRKKLILKGHYRSWFMCLWDIGQLIGLLWRFSLAHLSELFDVLNKIRKK